MNQDNKTIAVTIHFFTDNIAEEKGEVVPKVCWEKGTVSVRANKRHGIPATYAYNFNCKEDIPAAIEKAVREAQIKFVR